MSVQPTVSDLFTPAASGVGPFGVPLVPAQGSWLSVELQIATTVQLPTTSWQSGAPERTILAIEAVCFQLSDVNISLMAQGGFLQSAAAGYVTYTALNGTAVTIPVTPDPSNAAQNPTGALGWEDLLAAGLYDVERLVATQATGPLALVNLTGTSKGPYAAGSYHVENASNGATYSNQASLTIPSSIIAGSGGTISGVSPGVAFTIINTVGAHGLSPGQAVYLAIPFSTGISIFPSNPTPGSGFALVVAVTSNSLQVAVSSSGTWTAGGTVYACTTGTMLADLAGTASNASIGAVTITVTQNANVFASNLVGWSGSNWESNKALADRCLLSLAARSPNGASEAYEYFAETAVQLLAAQTPPYVLTNGPVTAQAFGNPLTGIETVAVASINPASIVSGANVTPGVAQLPISAVTNANPCVVTCTGPTSLGPGQTMAVTIDGTLGIVGVNGAFVGTYVSANAFSIPINTTSSGAYTGGGQVDGGDLGAIDALIQANVVPDNTTAITVSAQAFPVNIIATVVVPQANVAAYSLAVRQQLQTQVSSYPVGGDANSVPANSVPWDDILSALEEAGVVTLGAPSYVKSVTALNVNSFTTSGTGPPFPGTLYQALLAPPSITVIGV